LLIGYSHETTRSTYVRSAGGYGKPEGLFVTLPQPSSEFIHKGKWHERRKTQKTEDDVMKTLSCVIDIVQFVYKIHRRTRLCGTSHGRPTQQVGQKVVFSSPMLDIEIELLEFQSPSTQFLVLVLHRLDVLKRTVVRVNRDHRRSKVDGESANGSHQSQRFLLDRGIVEFKHPSETDEPTCTFQTQSSTHPFDYPEISERTLPRKRDENRQPERDP